ncbi:MAG: MFS transporter [Burkholderiaceae bacterium]
MSSADRASRPDPFLAAVCALGIAQITAWGTTYYCLGVLAGPISRDTGWSQGLIYFGFTVSLLMMGVVSTAAGRAIDRFGARAVMSAGAVLSTVALLLLSRVEGEAAYLAVWAFLGIGMRLSLYDAAFAALVQVVPSRGRQALSYLTLFGAFASTVFWILGHQLNEALGWRETLAWFAVIHLLVCLPLNWFGLSRQESEPEPVPEGVVAREVARTEAPLQGQDRRIAMAIFALVMSLNGFVFGAVTVQLVPLLEAAGLATAAAVWVGSMKGFAQFGGRLVEIVFGRRLHAMTVARVAVGVLPWSFVVLVLAAGHLQALLLFTLVMGASQGVITIVRGAVPLALFGVQGYATVLGLLATPVLIVTAASPTLVALIVDTWGWRVAQFALLGAAATSWLAIEGMARWYERRRHQPGPVHAEHRPE